MEPGLGEGRVPLEMSDDAAVAHDTVLEIPTVVPRLAFSGGPASCQVSRRSVDVTRVDEEVPEVLKHKLLQGYGKDIKDE